MGTSAANFYCKGFSPEALLARFGRRITHGHDLAKFESTGVTALVATSFCRFAVPGVIKGDTFSTPIVCSVNETDAVSKRTVVESKRVQAHGTYTVTPGLQTFNQVVIRKQDQTLEKLSQFGLYFRSEGSWYS